MNIDDFLDQALTDPAIAPPRTITSDNKPVQGFVGTPTSKAPAISPSLNNMAGAASFTAAETIPLPSQFQKQEVINQPQTPMPAAPQPITVSADGADIDAKSIADSHFALTATHQASAENVESLCNAIDANITQGDYQKAFDSFIQLHAALLDIAEQSRMHQIGLKQRMAAMRAKLLDSLSSTNVQFLQLTDELYKKLDEAKTLVDSNQLDEAARAYLEIRKLYDRLPAGFVERKTRTQDDILKFYLYLKQRKDASHDTLITKTFNQMKSLHDFASAAIANGAIDQGRELYDQMAEIYMGLPAGYADQKVQLFDLMSSINHQLSLHKQSDQLKSEYAEVLKNSPHANPSIPQAENVLAARASQMPPVAQPVLQSAPQPVQPPVPVRTVPTTPDPYASPLDASTIEDHILAQEIMQESQVSPSQSQYNQPNQPLQQPQTAQSEMSRQTIAQETQSTQQNVLPTPTVQTHQTAPLYQAPILQSSVSQVTPSQKPSQPAQKSPLSQKFLARFGQKKSVVSQLPELEDLQFEVPQEKAEADAMQQQLQQIQEQIQQQEIPVSSEVTPTVPQTQDTSQAPIQQASPTQEPMAPQTQVESKPQQAVAALITPAQIEAISKPVPTQIPIQKTLSAQKTQNVQSARPVQQPVASVAKTPVSALEQQKPVAAQKPVSIQIPAPVQKPVVMQNPIAIPQAADDEDSKESDEIRLMQERARELRERITQVKQMVSHL
ncbi:MAG TPA: hypothetical protein VK158_00370 [Acidobacteriota bacterium]|nr:hypothetical protein [Acidobacteriota bacterium]